MTAPETRPAVCCRWASFLPLAKRPCGVAQWRTRRHRLRTAALGGERRLSSEVTHPVFGYVLSYRRVIALQARLLVRALTGEIPGYPPFKTR
jgi:CRISPR/Cas system-associated endonuclease Cas1